MTSFGAENKNKTTFSATAGELSKPLMAESDDSVP